MNNSEYFIVFGAPDSEEQKAREVAEKLGIITATATYAGNPCNASNASSADGFRVDDTTRSIEDKKAILFECGRGAVGNREIAFICDHHTPGDPGFEMTAEQFWLGSSIGQLCTILGVEPVDEELLYTAAADHCPADAYQGRCPGIDPVKFQKFRLERKLEFYNSMPKNFSHKLTVKTLQDVIDEAKNKILSAQRIGSFYDLRPAGYVDELPEAAFQLGAGYITHTKEKGRRETKVICGGVTTLEMVEEFMRWAELQGYVDIYGNPVRGFAGAFIPQQVAFT